MGKKIDGFVLGTAAAIALYFYFYRMFENHTFSFICAALSFLLLSRMLRRIAGHISKSRWMEKKKICKNAGGTIMQLACAPAEQAYETVGRLLEKCYDAQYPLELIQCHPSVSPAQNQIFEIWKENQGLDRLVICTTGTCDSGARILAGSLHGPKIALLDAGALGRLMAEHPEEITFANTPPKRAKIRFRRMQALLINRKNVPRSLLFTAAMLAMYLLNGNVFYLVCSILLLFTALASLRQVRRPAKLF